MQNEESIEIVVELKPLSEGTCPYCGSKEITIKQKRPNKLKYNITLNQNKDIYLIFYKRSYKCKTCGKTFTQKTDIFQSGRRISNEMCWLIYKKTKESRSFVSIAKELNISPTTVINVFDQMVFEPKIKLPIAMCIDEKHFKTEHGKYVFVISDALNGKIIDMIESRKKEYLVKYFSKFSKEERDKVEFITSDMYEVYRDIKSMFFPKALYIIDKFHVVRLFTDKIQYFRIKYMKHLDSNTLEYKFLKKHWKIFVMNPWTKKFKKYSEETHYTTNGELFDYLELMRMVFNKCPDLLHIHKIYSDFCLYMTFKSNESQLNKYLEYIINQLLDSGVEPMETIGATLLEFSFEILNLFSEKNKYKLTNAIAEANNNRIEKLIAVSYGLSNFARFRKRILHIESKKEGE